jgi:hypothetical protein
MRVLVLLLAIFGPVLLPGALRFSYPRMRELRVFCITNLATFLPMVAMTLWLRNSSDLSCGMGNPGANCGGIATLFFALATAVLALWGLLASMAATAFVFRKK